MAARVQQQLEDMVPELNKLKELQLYSEEEVREIVKKRRNYEYMVISTDPVYARNAFRDYIKYEMELDRELQQRLRKSKNESPRTGLSDRVKSDYGSVPVRVTVRRRIHRIFKRCLTRFPTITALWKDYCSFCYRIKAYGVMNRVIMSALAKNPSCESLWRLATKYTLTQNGSKAAKNVVQMALRTNPKSLELFTLLLELEVHSTHSLFRYAQEDDKETEGVDKVELSSKTWIIILKHAIVALQGGDVQKMLFFAATICARIGQLTKFTRELKDYDDFPSTVFDEMFNRRKEHPLMGLYVWQHRLLESLLVKQHGGRKDAANPEAVFSSIIEDSVENKEMMSLVSQFIVCSLNTIDEDMRQDDEKPVWVMDVEGEVNGTHKEEPTQDPSNVETESDKEIDIYCEGIECLNDICFLRIPSPQFDSVNERCRYTKGLIDRKGLVSLHGVYRNFLSDTIAKVVEVIQSIVKMHNAEQIEDTLLSASDDFLRFIMLQIATQGAVLYNSSGYSLALELAKQCEGDELMPFRELVYRSLLQSMVNPELSEAMKAKVLLMVMHSHDVGIGTKLDAVRKSSVSLTRQQLQSAVDSTFLLVTDETRLLELVLSLMAASPSVLIDDFINETDVVNRIFSKMHNRIPGIMEALQKYRTNKLGLRNFGLLSVIVSFWQVRCIMEKLNAEIKEKEFGEFLNGNCQTVSQMYAKTASEVIDLCEIAATSCDFVHIPDKAKKVEFNNRCWNRYLRRAKDLEQLDLMIPIFNLHSFNFSSDAIGARAVAKLGKNFVVNID
ncbi:hepatocellular carcinoma-associated antigen 66 like protein [Babesia gibsoni]|uniref:Hepatocellular carcinoma-associated antigen 66 like protein n=1 Tax=Babesia gibsoni TaxID=33632 RepID=A0AAD8PG50_BABGI|nr:hepatocellular carcinoma-associated antigen 66 like protein [Babesia gibsoni]